jgi:hypothetical protein
MLLLGYARSVDVRGLCMASSDGVWLWANYDAAEGMGRGLIYLAFDWWELRKIANNHGQDSRSSDRHLNLGFPEYESGMPTIRQQR